MKLWVRLISTLSCASLVSACGAPAAHDPARLRHELSERQRVAELIARFAHSVQRHDFQAMAELFVEEGTWQASAGDLGFRHEGRVAIRAWLASNPGRVEVMFYSASPPAIELVSADRARVQTSITELLRSKDTGEVKQLFGVYSDEVVQRAGEWRFARRSFTLAHLTPLER